MLYIAVPSYALFATVGLCAATLFLFVRSDRVGLTFGDLLTYLIAAALFGFAGSRIVFSLSMIPSMEPVRLSGVLDYLLHGGFVFYGGLLGVIAGILFVTKWKRRDPREMLDFAAPAFPLFHALARIGCLFAGCCYGIPWLWGVVLQGETVVRFPVQLLESLCDLVIFAFLLLRSRRTGSSQGSFSLYMTSYAVCRFFLEFFRGDTVRGLWPPGLSTSQYISLFILAAFAVTFLRARRRANRKPVVR